MQLLQKLKKNIVHWWKYHTIFGSGWNEYHNPYYYWWKARKYFKRPKAHLVKGEFSGYFGMPCNTDRYKLLQFHFVGLGWKSKWDSPRHEWDPIICITWTNPWKTFVKSITFGNKFNSKGETGYYTKKTYWLGLQFNWADKDDSDSKVSSMSTWEAILDHVVWGHSIKWCFANHVWKSKDGDITIKNNLKNGILR